MVAPDLVLVLVEGLRADMDGGPGAEAAFFAPFGAELSHRWTAAYAQAPTPYLSVGTVLTGRYPSAIPLCGAPAGSQEAPWCHSLPADLPSLGTILGLYGYRSALWYGGMGAADSFASTFDHSIALAEGRDDWASPWDSLEEQVDTWWNADALSPRLLVLVLPDLVVQHRPDLRVAMGLPATPGPSELVTTMAAPGARRRREGSQPRRLDTQSLLEGLCVPGRPARPPQHAPKGHGAPPYGPRRPGENKDMDKAKPTRFVTGPWSALDHALVMTTYANAAGDLGSRLHGLLAGVAQGDERPRLTVLAGANGVSLGELTGSGAYPAAFAWNDLLLERTLHVPLAIASSREAPIVIDDTIVELVDVLPTLLAAAGATSPAGVAGRDLFSTAPEVQAPSAYAEFGDMLAVREGNLMLTLRARLHNATSLDPVLTEKLLCPGQEGSHLHDVVADPMQLRALEMDQPDEAERLERRMIAYRTGLGAPPAERVDMERLWELRLTPSEGYW